MKRRACMNDVRLRERRATEKAGLRRGCGGERRGGEQSSSLVEVHGDTRPDVQSLARQAAYADAGYALCMPLYPAKPLGDLAQVPGPPSPAWVGMHTPAACGGGEVRSGAGGYGEGAGRMGKVEPQMASCPRSPPDLPLKARDQRQTRRPCLGVRAPTHKRVSGTVEGWLAG